MPVTRTLSGGSARALSILTLSPRRPELVGLPSRPRALQNMQQQAPAESSTSPDPGSSRQQRKGLVLAAAVAAVWTLLLAAPHVSGPIFLVRPPITRRTSGFFEFHGNSCAYSLAQGNWTDVFQTVRCTNDTAGEYATCADTPQRHWRFGAAAAACGAHRFTAGEARALLGGQRLVFAGDSIARNLYGATLRLLGEPGHQVVVGHQDFQHELQGGIGLRFFWAPYPSNLTGLLARLPTEEGTAAAAVVPEGQASLQQEQVKQRRRRRERRSLLEQQQGAVAQQGEPATEGAAADATGAGEAATTQQQQEQQERRPVAMVTLSTFLWHLLHVTTADDFGQQLEQLKVAAAAYRTAAAAASAAAAQPGGGAGGAAPRLVLASGTETFPNRMKTEEKKKHMTPANLDAYNAALQKVGLLAPAGPFSLLDLFPLTQQCGEECTIDGIHSVPEVYDAALQLLLNIAAAPAAPREKGRAGRL